MAAPINHASSRRKGKPYAEWANPSYVHSVRKVRKPAPNGQPYGALIEAAHEAAQRGWAISDKGPAQRAARVFEWPVAFCKDHPDNRLRLAPRLPQVERQRGNRFAGHVTPSPCLLCAQERWARYKEDCADRRLAFRLAEEELSARAAHREVEEQERARRESRLRPAPVYEGERRPPGPERPQPAEYRHRALKHEV